MKIQIALIALGVILLPHWAVPAVGAPMVGSREFTPETIQKYAALANKHPDWLRSGLTLDIVKKTLAETAQLMMHGRGGKPLSYGAAQIELNKVRAMADYPFLECDSRVSRVWLQGMVKSLESLIDIRRTKLESYESNGRTDDPEYKKYVAAYQRSVRNFAVASASPKAATMDRMMFGKMLRLKRAVQASLKIDPKAAEAEEKEKKKAEKKADKKDDKKKDSKRNRRRK